jgi:hypothetical protein
MQKLGLCGRYNKCAMERRQIFLPCLLKGTAAEDFFYHFIMIRTKDLEIVIMVGR